MKKLDVIILLAAVTVFGFLAMLSYTGKESGGIAVVSVNGEEYGAFPLSEDKTLTIRGYDGGFNTLVIKDHKASISEADCPDALCVHQKAISADHETIVCLPHRVVIEIQADKENATDAIAR
ncbi:MAG: NusG domain II-containing protein [Lachnospiraceae bacterium]|nr:NusG domain II-containing protein [Lachnospiraceae bacterium]